MQCKATEKESASSMSRLRPQLNYSNVIATIALFVTLGGAAVAAGIHKNSVGPKQLKRGAVTSAKIRKGAVTNGKLGPNSVGPGNIGNGAVTSAKLGAGSVIASSIKNGVITTNKLGSEVVNTAKLAKNAVTNPILANGSVTPNKLSSEFGPLISALKSGQTLQGSFAIGGDGAAEAVAVNGQSFQFPLSKTPAVNVINPSTATNAACSGLGSGQAPAAAAGNLCVYVTSSTNLKALSVSAAGVNRLGFGLEATGEAAGKFSAYGQWAVTAP
jgi:hypothetical protein